MAKRSKKKMGPKEFLKSLGANPEKLGKFLKNPTQVMNADNVDKKHHLHIKNKVASEVQKKLSASPEEYVGVVC